MTIISVVSGYSPGLIGEIIRLHGVYYEREWNFDPIFEAGCATRLGDFLKRLAPEKDRIFSVWEKERVLGSVIIDGSNPELDPNQAHLRFFIVADSARGKGIGKALIAAATDFLSGCYETAKLETFAGLDTARALYEAAGFKLAEEWETDKWGPIIREQRFEWRAG